MANGGSAEPARLKQALTDGLVRIDREHPMETTIATNIIIAPAKADPKAAKGSAGLPATRPNAESRAASLSTPASAVSTAPQGSK
jgi:hypothetical protein